MPFTPFHFGPALAVREVVGKKYFGIWAFTVTQVWFDLEPLLNNYSHDYTHNPVFGAVYVLLAIALCWRWEGLLPATVGAIFGSITHLWLDAMYHLDVQEQMHTYGEWNIQHGPQNAMMICVLGFALFGFLRITRLCFKHCIPERTVFCTRSKLNRIVNYVRGLFKA